MRLLPFLVWFAKYQYGSYSTVWAIISPYSGQTWLGWTCRHVQHSVPRGSNHVLLAVFRLPTFWFSLWLYVLLCGMNKGKTSQPIDSSWRRWLLEWPAFHSSSVGLLNSRRPLWYGPRLTYVLPFWVMVLYSIPTRKYTWLYIPGMYYTVFALFVHEKSWTVYIKVRGGVFKKKILVIFFFFCRWSTDRYLTLISGTCDPWCLNSCKC